MNGWLFRVLLFAAALIALPTVASAQFPPPPPPPAPAGGAAVQNRWPEPPPRKPPPAAAQPAPKPEAAPAAETLDVKPEPKAKPQSEPKPKMANGPASSSTAVTCGGVFAKDTNHLKLAIKYNSRNIAYDDVDGPDGTKIKATILFPRDPKRRLEVLWNDDAARSDVQVISINGKSQWTAPKGLKLGLPLAALEKANGKPFKVSAFGADGSASVDSWEGGAMSKLPGDCKVGIRLAKAAAAAGGDKELMSSDASLKALKPTVLEILVGY